MDLNHLQHCETFYYQTVQLRLIADFIHSASLDEAREQIELNYGRLRVTYTQQKRKDGAGGGSITGGWDRIGNKVFS
jgi:type VI protein secretion system component Hcp